MKKCVLGFWFIVIGVLCISSVNATCTSSTPFQHLFGGVCGTKDPGPWINGTTQKFWCLSDASGSNDEGTAFNWWLNYAPGLWYVNGNWGNGGVDGCCGNSSEGFDSMVMMLAFSQDFNANNSNHSGEHVAITIEKNIVNGTFPMCGNPVCFETLPVPAFSAATSNDGTVSIILAGWAMCSPFRTKAIPNGMSL
ncbi:MAG: hypothetical protein A2Y62_19190 [Candidatus Fischerbacteria bacterium RBG_13_37_8]|uniref:Uncharacterized protein n=1 Tax=Candidatus Fischerbacteria bacterium RBG_13_37_8 TaxID=1817863 RepID=A0A1F5VU92_9BACT|nr:MAG: hypothetical protein A2Y62_19190 [Candidatus Fischerbacteria bacterium RBG_13_37_8]